MQQEIEQLDKLSTLLDSKFRMPGTSLRFGWDTLVGLIPGVGDAVALLPAGFLCLVAQIAVAEVSIRPQSPLERAVSEFFHYVPDGQLSADYAKEVQRVEVAKYRATIAGKFIAMDLDADGNVSRSEYSTARKLVGNREQRDLANLRSRADENGDNMVSAIEVDSFLEDEVNTFAQTGNRRSNRLSSFVEMDADTDGVITAEEIIASFELQNPNNCALPQPSDKAKIIVVGSLRGSTVSPLGLGDVRFETTIADMEIELGTRPLYIVVLGGTRAIMNMSGQTGRVEHLVVLGGGAVSRFERERVAFSSQYDCGVGNFFDVDQVSAKAARAVLARKLGQKVDKLLAANGVIKLSLPSGKKSAHATDISPLKYSERELLRVYPGGVAEIAAEDIVSSEPLTPFQVLPAQAGLLQLVTSGALTLLEAGVYAIEKPIPHFPVGFSRDRRVSFVLRDGVPMPDGDAGTSAVYSEKGECLSPGQRCW